MCCHPWWEAGWHQLGIWCDCAVQLQQGYVSPMLRCVHGWHLFEESVSVMYNGSFGSKHLLWVRPVELEM